MAHTNRSPCGDPPNYTWHFCLHLEQPMIGERWSLIFLNFVMIFELDFFIILFLFFLFFFFLWVLMRFKLLGLLVVFLDRGHTIAELWERQSIQEHCHDPNVRTTHARG